MNFDLPTCAVRFIDAVSGRERGFIPYDSGHPWAGWLFYRNGQDWVSLRKATDDDVQRIDAAAAKAKLQSPMAAPTPTPDSRQADVVALAAGSFVGVAVMAIHGHKAAEVIASDPELHAIDWNEVNTRQQFLDSLLYTAEKVARMLRAAGAKEA